MRAFFDPRQLAHAPVSELHNGAFKPHAETPERATSILRAIGPTLPPSDHGEAPLLGVHSAGYLAFLKTAYADWSAAGRPGEAGAYAFPVVRRRDLDLDRVDARFGHYSYDAATPIGPRTWEAATGTRKPRCRRSMT